MNVHSVIWIGNKAETTQMSISGWMDKQNVIQQNMIWTEKWSPDTCYSMDEPWKHAKRKKLGVKDHILYNSVYMKCPEWANQ